MKTPQMPSQLKSLLRSAWRAGDVDSIVHFNRIWWEHVKQTQEEQRKEIEEQLRQSEGEYN